MPAKYKINFAISVSAVFVATLLIFPAVIFAAPTCDPSGVCSVLTTDGSGNFGIGANSDSVSRLFIKNADTSTTKFGLKIVSSDGSTPVFVIRNDGLVTLASSTAFANSGLVFPDGTKQTTAFTGSTSNPVTIAGNVGGGDFGSNTGGGNYSFPANVGIGKTDPTSRLEIVSAANNHLKLTFGPTGSATSTTIYQDNNGSFIIAPYGPAYVAKAAKNNILYVLDYTNAGAWTRTAGSGFSIVYNSVGVTSFPATGNSYINNGGNFGIGTASPAQALDVYGNIKVQDGDSRYIGFATGAGTFYRGMYSDTITTGFALRFINSASGNTDPLIIFGSSAGGVADALAVNVLTGNVGIGTTAPDGKLAITKNTAATWNSNENDYAIKITDGGSNVGLLMGVSTAVSNTAAIQAMDPGTTWGGRNLLLQPVGGNVGIATTTPTYPLTVAGTIHSSTGGYRFPDGTTQTTAAVAGTNYWSLSGSNLTPTSTAYSVSIGTTDPNFGGGTNSKFTVVNSSTAFAAGYSAAQPAFALNPSSNGSFTIYDYAAGSWTSGMIQNAGKLVIGTTSPDANYKITTAGGGIKAESTTQPAGYFNSTSGYGLIVNTGNVGIGTTAPTAKLSFGTYYVNTATPTADQQTSHIRLYDTGNGSVNYGIGVSTGALNIAANQNTGTIRLYTNSSERVRIDATGNVGINQASPDANYKLTLSGGGIKSESTTQPAGYFNSTSGYGLIVNTGNVGIGTVTPQTGVKLDVRSGSGDGDSAITGYGYNGNGGRAIMGYGWATAGTGYNYGIYGNSGGTRAGGVNIGGYFQASGAASNYALITGSGNVGIGTSTPASKLTVAGVIESTTGGVKYPDGNTQTVAYMGGSQTVVAGNVASGAFGSNTGGGNYSFPARVGVFQASPEAVLHVGNGTGAFTAYSEIPRLFVKNGNTHTVPIAQIVSGGSGGCAGCINETLRLESVDSAGSAKTNIGLRVLASGGTNNYAAIFESGNVGIGSTAPTDKLGIVGNIGIGVSSVIGSGLSYTGAAGAGSNATLELYNAGTGYTNLNNQGYGINLLTAGVGRLTILNNGNVGIGTSNPTRKLDVPGSARVGYLNITDDINTVTTIDQDGNIYNPIGGALTYWNGSAVITGLKLNAGNVGIGTASPGAKLDVQGKIQIGNPSGTYAAYTDAIYGTGNLHLAAATALYLNTANSAPVYINPVGGNVGVGNTSAGVKLDVTGDVRASAAVYAAGASGFYSTTYVTGARNPIWRFANADGHGFSYFQGTAGIGSADTLGIHFGTATAAGSQFQFVSNGNLNIAGQIKIAGGTPGAGKVLTSDAAGLASWATPSAGTNYFTLSGSNLYPTSTAYNVGIGTSTPAYKLSVAGKVNADSQAGAGGYISTGNHGGTGSAAYFPSGLWANGANSWIYGTVTFNGALAGATSISAGSFTGAGTGLTGTAASLTAGAANSVAWANVTGKPTMVDLAGTNTWTGINYFQGNKGAAATIANTNTWNLEAYSNDGGAAAMSFHRAGAYAVNVGLNGDNSFAIGGWSDGAATRISIAANGNTTFGTGASKINVGTVDPPYTINGEQYATYLSGMTGQKEETTGEVNIECRISNIGCEYVIDFAKAEKGSDLWLFAKTANIKNNFDKMTVLLTPAFDGKVWYEKDTKNNVLKVFAIPATSYTLQDTSFSVSYRLTAPRFDSAKWLNTRNEPGVDGFIIND